ncbi:unnamed protein product [Lepeophtheirus salmonis]|uniref:(salmon louse) hypothetical protein n=1 Tax=Lepeophtheirus salmonis TaxID=72036 RepID=A0A7R8CYP1_LEPSM|nr:unnamed protein product [Lepeophtheirus salmonis]CAF2925881.1 unnamed protein product [Lepeophtheirus salmonis]
MEVKSFTQSIVSSKNITGDCDIKVGLDGGKVSSRLGSEAVVFIVMLPNVLETHKNFRTLISASCSSKDPCYVREASNPFKNTKLPRTLEFWEILLTDCCTGYNSKNSHDLEPSWSFLFEEGKGTPLLQRIGLNGISSCINSDLYRVKKVTWNT